MTREFADVALGGFTIGFAWIEVEPNGVEVHLASAGLLSSPTDAAPELRACGHCTCLPEHLAFARVRSRRGAAWSLGVRVCAAHRCLRPA
jgi:hypothetical protein